MPKLLTGTYIAYYRLWKITFPYWSETFLHAGTKKDAMAFAKKYQKRKKIPYSAKIKEVHYSR